MARGMALEPQHALAPACQVMERRAPHGPEAADDDIEMGHSPRLSQLRATPLSCSSMIDKSFDSSAAIRSQSSRISRR